MYVGSKTVECREEYVWVNGQIEKREVQVSPAMLRTFIEILSNAIDNVTRGGKMTFIDVTLSDSGCSIKNDGAIIPVEKSEKEDLWNHTLIFGHLLSGSNYDDSEKRLTSGRNGLGAKLTNVLSTTFTVEGTDPERKLKLVQTWNNNMRATTGPKVSKYALKNGYTRVSWEWDMKWFGLSRIPFELFAWHVLNTAMITGLRVTLNGERLPNKLADYFRLMNMDGPSLKFQDEQCTVMVSRSKGDFEQISFVNGILTKNGGRHVNAWIEAICRPIITKLSSKTVTVSLRDVKQHLNLLVIANIPNPEFDGQEKNELKAPTVTTKAVTPAHITKILGWGIKDLLTSRIQERDAKQLSKTITTTVTVDGYSRANKAGGPLSKDCTLIVCEGLSAKTFAMEGVKVGMDGKKGRDWFGVFPLRGKILNTRNATIKGVTKNQCITNLIKIIGLDCVKPNNTANLNYGRVCILTDADVDGIHIESLLLNFFHSMFPIMLTERRVISMKTPILRIGSGPSTKYFFDERTFKRTREKGAVKYFKGLGTNKSEDIQHIFGIKLLHFIQDSGADSAFETAFAKSEATERRQWLESYDSRRDDGDTLDDEKSVTVTYPISKLLNQELIKFIHDDCKRSIPSVFDGLKESQRKIVYAAKKRGLTSDVKVAQFGAYVAEHTNYHHGEENLFRTIIKMAQGFTGSNNVPLFSDEGQFGSRLAGGEDASAPRYIFTKQRPYFSHLFVADDDALLSRREDDGDLVEPYYYVPTIPLLLVNGCVGIGTGWMCNMPQFNPQDVIKAAHLLIDGKIDDFTSFVDGMKPWYKNFTGEVVRDKSSPTKFHTTGRYTIEKDTVTVTELPVGMWTDRFEQDLREMESKKQIKKLDTHSTTTTINTTFKITDAFDRAQFAKKMSTQLNLDNIVVFDRNDKLCRVSIRDIFQMWGAEKLGLNQKRKDARVSDLKRQIQTVQDRITFISLVKSKKITLTDPEEQIINTLEKHVKDADTIKALMDTPVRTLTLERLTRLQRELETLKATLVSVLKKSPQDMWKEDVAALCV